MLLLGTWVVPLEGRGLALPQPFRAAAADGLIITRGFERCLQAFPAEAWRTFARRIGDLPLTADAARTLRRLIFGAAVDLALDSLDAVALPRNLLAHAELQTQAVFVGCATYFEIWSAERWRAADQTLPGEHLAGLRAGLAPAYAPAIL
jgi:MraZ protein